MTRMVETKERVVPSTTSESYLIAAVYAVAEDLEKVRGGDEADGWARSTPALDFHGHLLNNPYIPSLSFPALN